MKAIIIAGVAEGDLQRMYDLISRQKAIESMASAILLYPNELYKNLNVYENAEKLARYGLERVPSIEPRKGRWIHEGIHPNYHLRCSECRKVAMWSNGISYKFPNFCPNCGCDMREGEQE